MGPKLAWRLLLHLRTVSRVFSASIDELTKVNGIGIVAAKKIREVLEAGITK